MWELPPDGTLRMTLASNPTNYYSLGESGCQTKWSDAIFLHKEKPNTVQFADVAELADALDSGSSARKGVEVQVLSSALLFYSHAHRYLRGFSPLREAPFFYVHPDDQLTISPLIFHSSGGFGELTTAICTQVNLPL